MPLGIPVGQRMEVRWEDDGAAERDRTLLEERGDAERLE